MEEWIRKITMCICKKFCRLFRMSEKTLTSRSSYGFTSNWLMENDHQRNEKEKETEESIESDQTKNMEHIGISDQLS